MSDRESDKDQSETTGMTSDDEDDETMVTESDLPTLDNLKEPGITEPPVPEGEEEQQENTMNEEVMDKEHGSVLLSILSQVRFGMDLSKVTLPVFILEPRSFLELLTDFQAHSQLITAIPLYEDPLTRFLAVCKWYVSGYHLKTQGVKKPYNPILGETFMCSYDHGEHGVQYFLAEQVSHHPPEGAFYCHNMERQWVVTGELRPRSKFMANTVASIMEGKAQGWFLEHDGEHFVANYPSVYARGILFGSLVMELGGKIEVSCAKHRLAFRLEFKTKGYFRGKYNVISGKIIRLPEPKNKKKQKRVKSKNAELLYTISGSWDSNVYITDVATKTELTLFDPVRTPVHNFYLREEQQMEPQESRRLWRKVTNALWNKDTTTATEEKRKLEDSQRARAKEMKKNKETYQPKYFMRDPEDKDTWIYRDLQKTVFTDEQKRTWLPWYVQPPTHPFAGDIPEEFSSRAVGVLNTPETVYPGYVPEEPEAEADGDEDEKKEEEEEKEGDDDEEFQEAQ
jgi:oxysterol-binding protein-related protein 8